MALGRRLLVVCAVLGAHLVLTALPAEAATALREASPANGETIATMPDFVRLTFTDIVTEPKIDVLGPTGQPVNSSPISPRGNTVLQPVQPSGAGLYTVSYEARGPDGGVVRGSYTFTLAAGGAAPNASTPTITGSAGTSPSPGDTSPSPSPAHLGAPPPVTRDPAGNSWRWYVVALVVVLVAAGGFLLYRRRVAR
jgi:hypothetical protein